MNNSSLSTDILGVWWLLSREDRTKDGEQRIDPILGPDPIAILAYAKDHFSAQFMKRNRTNAGMQPTQPGKNNTSAIGGYDAYFGTYQINGDNGKVSHTLVGSINPLNIGITVERTVEVNGDKLTIKLDTSTGEGEAIVRTLVWQRLS